MLVGARCSRDGQESACGRRRLGWRGSPLLSLPFTLANTGPYFSNFPSVPTAFRASALTTPAFSKSLEDCGVNSVLAP